MTLPTFFLPSALGMISWNELGAAFWSVLPVSMLTRVDVKVDESADISEPSAIWSAIDLVPVLPTVTPSALTSVPSGSCENTENLVSYEYWIPAEPIYRLMSLSLLSRYFLNALRLFSVMLLVIEAVPLMAASSG